MNEFILNISDELIDNHIKRGLHDIEMLITKIRNHLYEIKSEKDKVDLLTLILEANELKYQKHDLACTKKDDCPTDKKHIKINYFLHQELEEIGVRPSDNFTREEKENCNEKLEELIQTLINSNELLYEQAEFLKSEIQELKSFYVFGKKSWKEKLGGKLTSMVISGVITKATAEPIIEDVLKPGADFIIGRLLG